MPRLRRLVGVVVLAAGVVLLIVAFTVLDWLRPGLDIQIGSGNSGSTAAGIRSALASIRAAVAVAGESGQLDTGIAGIYFAWFGWTVAAVAAISGAVSMAARSVLGIVTRSLGVVVAVAGVGFTFWAIVIVRYGRELATLAGQSAPGYGAYLSHAGAGFWCAVTGFLALAVAPLVAGAPSPTR